MNKRRKEGRENSMFQKQNLFKAIIWSKSQMVH